MAGIGGLNNDHRHREVALAEVADAARLSAAGEARERQHTGDEAGVE